MKTIRARLILATALLLLVSLLAVSLGVYLSLRGALVARLGGEIREVASMTATATGDWVRTSKHVVGAAGYAASLDDPRAVLLQAKQSGQFDLFYVGYADKRIEFTDPQNLPAGYDATQRPWYIAAVASDKPIMTAPYVDAASQALVVSFAHARREGGQVLGVVAADVTLTRVVEQVLGVKFSVEGYAFLMSAKGEILVHPQRDLVGKAATDLTPAFGPEQRARFAGALGDAEIAGKASYAGVFPVPDTDLLLGVVIDRQSALAPLSRLLWTAIGITLLVLVIALPLMALLFARMLGGLALLRDMMQGISGGGGDLTRQLAVVGEDELAQTSSAFNRFLGVLRSMMLEVRGESGKLADGVETIDARVQVLADHSAQLSDTAAANAATIEEITVSVTQIADNANEANALVRETGRMSEAGAAAIAEVSREFGRSADSVQQVAAMMQTLNNRAGEISGIVSVIREIADQTNLLALNAAIEAARAGEQGRGFAVVADEVRKLAERTGRATLEIGTMIQGMTGDTASAYASMEGSIQCVSQGARASEEAARQMHEIQTRMREAMQRLEDIASSTSEQQLATTQMAQAAEQITNRMHENDQALQAVRETLGMLGNVSRRLRELIGGFRL